MEYRNGFGEKSGGEFWMGLEKMRQLLETGRWQLFIGLRSLKYPTWSYIIYNDVRIGEEIKGDRFCRCDVTNLKFSFDHTAVNAAEGLTKGKLTALIHLADFYFPIVSQLITD